MKAFWKNHPALRILLMLVLFVICLCLLLAGRASAQWVVSDPGNLAQGIINASKNIIHTSKTAANMVNNCAPV